MPDDRPRRAPAGAALLQQDVTAAITGAVFEELAAVGYGRLSIEGVAKRAGVGKTAVYRRWPTKQAMVVAALTEVAVAAIDVPDTGRLRDDVLQYVHSAAEALEHPLASTIIPDMLAEVARSGELTDLVRTGIAEPRRDKAALLLRQAVDRGELPPDCDIDLGLDMLAGPLFWRLSVMRAPIDATYYERLTDKILAALLA